MTYSAGGLIQATDYNGFANTTANANVNGIWGVGSGDKGWGQSALATVSTGGTVSATNWASLVNTISSMASQTGTTITSRSAPVTGNLIQILSNLNTDLTNITTNRNNAVAVGTQYTSWTGSSSKTTATSGATWSIAFTHTVTFASADAARHFFNGGGLIKLEFSKTSTGALGDPEWNDLANTLCGDIYFSGVAASHTIAGTAYTGTTKSGGTGTPNTLSTTTGFYALVPNAAYVTVYKQFADTAPYTSNFISVAVKLNTAGNILTFLTTWDASDGDAISGGTAASGATPGTAPCTICTYFPPSLTYLTSSSWGTPTVVGAVA
jgi:hypothetical protein